MYLQSLQGLKRNKKKTWLILAAEYKAVVSLLNALN